MAEQGARRMGSAVAAASMRVPEGRWLSHQVFLMRWFGEVDKLVASRGLEVIKAALRERPPKYVVIDATEMTGFKRDVSDSAVACLQAFKEAGMERMFAVMPGSAIRMFLSAMTMVVQAKIEFCGDMNAAMQGLAKYGVKVSL
jgi:2-methylisocitrate lyase-like PEP mutase family enzyme